MLPHPLVRLVSPTQLVEDGPFRRLLKGMDHGRLTQVIPNTDPRSDNDPYLLLLLADQELVEGRKEQARHLVEAAYESFDQKTNAKVYTLHLAGLR
jgi:hypothetical protein